MNAELPPPQDLPPLLVVGAGKLGSAVAEAWVKQSGTVRDTVGAGETWVPEGLVFEATAPDAAFANVMRCVEANVPVVTGTTGWLDRLGEFEAAVVSAKCTAFWSTNFSPGVRSQSNRATASGIFGKIPGYRARFTKCITSIKDAPSGTVTLQQHAMQGRWSQALPIESKREGEVIGLHALAWDSVHDAVVLQHEAKSVWVLPKAPCGHCAGRQRHLEHEFGLYTMTDLFRYDISTLDSSVAGHCASTRHAACTDQKTES